MEGGTPSGLSREVEQRARAFLDPKARLPPRAEVVALADQLAILAEGTGPPADAARMLRLAADVRARSFRVGHADADAREALELYAAAGRRGLVPAPEEACQAAREHAVIAAELAHDPAVYYREAYVASKLFSDGPCGSSLQDGLRSLAAYRPANDVLADLDKEAAQRRGEAERSREGKASDRLASADADGVVISPALGKGEQRAVKVVSVEPYGSSDRARVVITLSGPTTFEVGELPPGTEKARLFVDIARAKPPPQREWAVGGIVERVRAGAQENATRIVLDLSAAAYRRVFYLPEPFRVIVDVASHPPAEKAPAPGTRRLTRIALDPGHGGTDPGAIGPSGLREKDVALDIAHLAAPVLSRELGILTLLTRDDDRVVSLDERTARANAFHADLFVSIHCNASDNGGAHGVMSFVLDTTRDEIAARVAARENAASLSVSTQVASIASDLKLADLGARSTRFAELLQRSSMASLAGKYRDAADQGVKTAGFFVLVGAEMPSVLYETSFISNAGEEKRLAATDYRQKLADAIVNAVKAYREGR
jgi:N-acetylmuramoyl-L-alanine amidase